MTKSYLTCAPTIWQVNFEEIRVPLPIKEERL